MLALLPMVLALMAFTNASPTPVAEADASPVAAAACATATLKTLPSPVTLHVRPILDTQAASLPLVIGEDPDTSLGFYYNLTVAPATAAEDATQKPFTFDGSYLYGYGGTQLQTSPAHGGVLGTGLLAPEQLYMSADSTGTSIPVEVIVKCDGPGGSARYTLQLVGVLSLHSNVLVSGLGGVKVGAALYTPVTGDINLDLNLLGTQVEIELIQQEDDY